MLLAWRTYGNTATSSHLRNPTRTSHGQWRLQWVQGVAAPRTVGLAPPLAPLSGHSEKSGNVTENASSQG